MTTANKITLFRVILIPVFLILLYTGAKWAALAVYIVACISDTVDGYIARHYNQVTDFGKFMDPLADKILVLSEMPGWLVAIVLFREFGVSGLRLIAVERGRVIAAVWSGKIKTTVTMVGIIAMLAFSENQTLDTVCGLLILLTTVWYCHNGGHYRHAGLFGEPDFGYGLRAVDPSHNRLLRRGVFLEKPGCVFRLNNKEDAEDDPPRLFISIHLLGLVLLRSAD